MQNLCANDACALQMKRRKTPSPAVVAARSQGLSSITAARGAKRANPTPGASSAAAPVDSGTDPPPAGRFRRSCRTPTTQVQSGRPLQLLPLLRTERWRLVEVMPQYVYQPHSPGSHAHGQQLSPSRCVQRCARHARTTCTRQRCGAGCFGGFCCTDHALHVGRAAACLAGPAAACLPLHPPACPRSTGLRPSHGCSPAMSNRLRMPAMLTALRRKTTRVTCR